MPDIALYSCYKLYILVYQAIYMLLYIHHVYTKFIMYTATVTVSASLETASSSDQIHQHRIVFLTRQKSDAASSDRYAALSGFTRNSSCFCYITYYEFVNVIFHFCNASAQIKKKSFLFRLLSFCFNQSLQVR